ncbi:MAG: hypothetical protein HWD59_08280 [Coxiellaceae bacterium]|nr:MAG: hypothetical protein HWD59_08280 [Coxiellaceae bacterium]
MAWFSNFHISIGFIDEFFVGFQGIHFADNFSPIGINTAVCFLLLGTGLTASVWYRSQLSQIDLSKSLSLIIASGVFLQLYYFGIHSLAKARFQFMRHFLMPSLFLDY